MTEPGAGPHRVSIEGTPLEFEQVDGDTILRAALRAGIGVPYECNAGGCGSCGIEVADGTVDDPWPDAPGRSDRDRRKGRVLACQVRATSDVRIRVRPSADYVADPVPRRQPAVVAEVSPITDDLWRFLLRTSSAARFRPGQYLSLQVNPALGARNYSMSNLANDDGLWELMIRRVPGGVATTELFEHVRVGDEVEIDGPFGVATLRPDVDRGLVCVAGGSGLAPMLSIARGAAAAGLLASRELCFFYGARTPADVCGGREIAELAATGATISYVPVVSDPTPGAAANWDGATGFVHSVACTALGGRLADFEWYCAGPPAMTQALTSELILQHKVPVGQIHYDRFF